MKIRICVTCLLLALCHTSVAAQLFQDSGEGEISGGFPSQWDLIGGLATVADTAEGRMIVFPPSGGTIFPLVNGEEDSYLGETFSIEFDLFFDETSSLYGQRFYLRLWPGSSGFTDGDIRYKPFVIHRDGLETSWNHPAPGVAKNHLPALQTLEPVWRHVAVELSSGSLRVTMDDQLVFFLPRFKMQPTMVSVGGAINDSVFPATIGFANFRIFDGGGAGTAAAPGTGEDSAGVVAGTGGGSSTAPDGAGRPTGPTVSSLPAGAALPVGGGIAGSVAGGEVPGDGETGRPSGPTVRTLEEQAPDVSEDILSTAMEENPGSSESVQPGASGTQTPAVSTVPTLGYTGGVLVYSGITGGEGDYTQRVVFTESQEFPYGIETRENFDKPCTVYIHSAPGTVGQGESRPPGARVTEYDVCSEGLPRINPLTTLARLLDKPEAGTFKPITAIQVCNNGINNRVKGIRAQVRKARQPDGAWDPSYETVTFQEMMNCVSWKPLVSCPANTYAVGVILHFRDGDIVSPRDFLSGLELNCSEAQWH